MDPTLARLTEELEAVLSRLAGPHTSTMGSGEWKIFRARIWSLEKRIKALKEAAEEPDEE
jgi:hypothetical protein